MWAEAPAASCTAFVPYHFRRRSRFHNGAAPFDDVRCTPVQVPGSADHRVFQVVAAGVVSVLDRDAREVTLALALEFRRRAPETALAGEVPAASDEVGSAVLHVRSLGDLAHTWADA